MSYPLQLPGEQPWEESDDADVLSRLEGATDALDLLLRADAVTPREIDLWAALVHGDPPELLVRAPAPLSPSVTRALAASLGAQAGVWAGESDAPDGDAPVLQLSCARMDGEVLTALPEAWRDRVVEARGELVAVCRAAASDGRNLTLDRWRRADETLEVVAWLLAHFSDAGARRPGVTDPLSGAYTRDFFEAVLAIELARTERQASELTIVLLQLRRSLPLLADQSPPPQALATAARVMRAQLRSADIIARVASRRLAALLPSTGPRSGMIAAQRLGEALQDQPDLQGWSVDIGVSGLGIDLVTPQELLQQASEAMRAAERTAARYPYVFV